MSASIECQIGLKANKAFIKDGDTWYEVPSYASVKSVIEHFNSVSLLKESTESLDGHATKPATIKLNGKSVAVTIEGTTHRSWKAVLSALSDRTVSGSSETVSVANAALLAEVQKATDSLNKAMAEHQKSIAAAVAAAVCDPDKLTIALDAALAAKHDAVALKVQAEQDRDQAEKDRDQAEQDRTDALAALEGLKLENVHLKSALDARVLEVFRDMVDAIKVEHAVIKGTSVPDMARKFCEELMQQIARMVELQAKYNTDIGHPPTYNNDIEMVCAWAELSPQCRSLALAWLRVEASNIVAKLRGIARQCNVRYEKSAHHVARQILFALHPDRGSMASMQSMPPAKVKEMRDFASMVKGLPGEMFQGV